MTVHVTQEDINNGRACDSMDCPIALAMERTLNESYVCVGTSSVGIGFGANYKTCALLKEAAIFVLSFDNHIAVQPFSFELPL